MRRIRKIVYLSTLLRSYNRSSKKQQQFIKNELGPVLQRAQQESDGTLTQKDFQKITKYYALAVPAILGESFAIFRGRAMDAKERLALTYLGAITGLFDDFFDENDMCLDYIKSMILEPKAITPKNSHEELFLALYKEAMKYIDDLDRLKQAFIKVYNAQVASLEQMDSSVTVDRLAEITAMKGGFSLLFYRCAFVEYINEEEENLIYHMGAVGQLENDIFDVYKDCQQHIETLATKATDIETLRSTYLGVIHQVYVDAMNIKGLVDKLGPFLNQFYFIACRGLVCLDFFEAETEKHKGKFFPKKMSRKELICDTEQPSNILKLLSYYLKGYKI